MSVPLMMKKRNYQTLTDSNNPPVKMKRSGQKTSVFNCNNKNCAVNFDSKQSKSSLNSSSCNNNNCKGRVCLHCSLSFAFNIVVNITAVSSTLKFK